MWYSQLCCYYPLPKSMLSLEGIDCNNTSVLAFMSSWIRLRSPTLLLHISQLFSCSDQWWHILNCQLQWRMVHVVVPLRTSWWDICSLLFLCYICYSPGQLLFLFRIWGLVLLLIEVTDNVAMVRKFLFGRVT